MNNLPKPIIKKIISNVIYLRIRDLAAIRLINKHFKRASNEFWYEIYHHKYMKRLSKVKKLFKYNKREDIKTECLMYAIKDNNSRIINYIIKLNPAYKYIIADINRGKSILSRLYNKNFNTNNIFMFKLYYKTFKYQTAVDEVLNIKKNKNRIKMLKIMFPQLMRNLRLLIKTKLNNLNKIAARDVELFIYQLRDMYGKINIRDILNRIPITRYKNIMPQLINQLIKSAEPMVEELIKLYDAAEIKQIIKFKSIITCMAHKYYDNDFAESILMPLLKVLIRTENARKKLVRVLCKYGGVTIEDWMLPQINTAHYLTKLGIADAKYNFGIIDEEFLDNDKYIIAARNICNWCLTNMPHKFKTYFRTYISAETLQFPRNDKIIERVIHDIFNIYRYMDNIEDIDIMVDELYNNALNADNPNLLKFLYKHFDTDKDILNYALENKKYNIIKLFKTLTKKCDYKYHTKKQCHNLMALYAYNMHIQFCESDNCGCDIYRINNNKNSEWFYEIEDMEYSSEN